MIEKFFSNRATLIRLRAGPLGPYVDTFAVWLTKHGYARSTAGQKISLVSALSHWLQRRGHEADVLDEQKVDKFLHYRRKHVHVHRGNLSTLQSLLQHLREIGVLRPASASETEEDALQRTENDFAQYLLGERGLSHATLLNYLPVVRQFLRERFGASAFALKQLLSSDVTQFVLRNAARMNPRRAQLMVSALRAFFRFLQLRGEISQDLAACVPSVAAWRSSELPKFLEPEQIKVLLESCDQNRATGQRDYAILLLLARLGLRAGEVVALTLDDIDWEAGELTIRGKGSQQDRLPLPHDVGEAMARYLQNTRPQCLTRRVFVRMKAPLQGFASSVAICTIVRRAVERAGLHPARKGAHLLRHSLATQMIRGGASLAEIGQILRHRLASTTEIYAKVDLEALRALAQPWPGGAS